MKEQISRILLEVFSAKEKEVDAVASRISALISGGSHFEKAFTGMHDKHGVPICEGDRLRIYYKGEYVICHVVYDPRNAAFLLRWPDGYINQYFMNGSSYEVQR